MPWQGVSRRGCAARQAGSWPPLRRWCRSRQECRWLTRHYFWPRPGRVFAAARSHTFSQLADAIDTAFARRDRSHLHKFELPDGRVIGQPEFDDFDLEFLDGEATKLSTLSLSGQFVYEFDFGDSWTHLCEVGTERIDPESELGIVPWSPFPYWGWGSIPDQYGRRWSGDDGESTEPPDPASATCRHCGRGGACHVRPPVPEMRSIASYRFWCAASSREAWSDGRRSRFPRTCLASRLRHRRARRSFSRSPVAAGRGARRHRRSRHA